MLNIVGKKGYLAQPKLSDLGPNWPCKPESDKLSDAALYMPGPESDMQAIKFIQIYAKK